MEAKLGITDAEYKTWPVMHQRMAFYAKVYIPRVGFTLSPGEVSEYKALIQKGIDYEQKRIWTAKGLNFKVGRFAQATVKRKTDHRIR